VLTVDPPVSVLVSLPNHLIHLVIRQFLSNRCHNMAQFSGRDEAVVVPVKHFECFSNLFLRVRILHLSRHHGEEFCIDAVNTTEIAGKPLKASIPGKSIVPLLSESTSLIMSCSSDSLGFWPRDRMTVPSSLVVISPVRRDRQSVLQVNAYTYLQSHIAMPRPSVQETLGQRKGSTYHHHLCPTNSVLVFGIAV